MKNLKRLITHSSLVLAVVGSFSAVAGGSKAPGNGDFQSLGNVKANRDYVLRSDSKDSKPAPLNLPSKVAFTQVKVGESRDSVMILRNDKGVNFRFDLPDSITLGSMKNPLSFDSRKPLHREGDVIFVEAGINGTGQEVGIRLKLKSEYRNSYSTDGRESCTIARTRQIREEYCWRDDYGRRHCDVRWITQTYYENGYRDTTTHYSSESASYDLELLDRSNDTQMSSTVHYSDSSSYTTYRSACYRY